MKLKKVTWTSVFFSFIKPTRTKVKYSDMEVEPLNVGKTA